MTSYSNITNENEKEIEERGYRLKKNGKNVRTILKGKCFEQQSVMIMIIAVKRKVMVSHNLTHSTGRVAGATTVVGAGTVGAAGVTIIAGVTSWIGQQGNGCSQEIIDRVCRYFHFNYVDDYVWIFCSNNLSNSYFPSFIFVHLKRIKFNSYPKRIIMYIYCLEKIKRDGFWNIAIEKNRIPLLRNRIISGKL